MTISWQMPCQSSRGGRSGLGFTVFLALAGLLQVCHLINYPLVLAPVDTRPARAQESRGLGNPHSRVPTVSSDLQPDVVSNSSEPSPSSEIVDKVMLTNYTVASPWVVHHQGGHEWALDWSASVGRVA